MRSFPGNGSVTRSLTGPTSGSKVEGQKTQEPKARRKASPRALRDSGAGGQDVGCPHTLEVGKEKMSCSPQLPRGMALVCSGASGALKKAATRISSAKRRNSRNRSKFINPSSWSPPSCFER